MCETDEGVTRRFSMIYAPCYDAAASVRSSVGDAAENRLQLEYRYQENEQDYLDGRIETSLLKPVYVTLQERYDFNDQTNLEQVVMFEYRAQCWSLFLTYRDRLNDKEYLVSFALGGLGKVNKVGGSLASDQAD